MNSQEIESRLKTVRSRIRAAQRTRAGWILATVFLAGLLLIMAADYAFAPLPNAARWVLFGGWLLVFIYAVKCVLGPLLRPISLVQIARWIEARHPEMEERLSTVLELSKSDGGVSPDLLEALGKAANEDITRVDPQVEVKSAQKRRRWVKPAIALATVLALCLVIWPKEVSRLLVRAVVPFSNIGNAGAVQFTIDPGNLEVMEGDAIRIRVGYTGDARDVGLVMKMNDGTETTQPLQRDGKVFRYTLDPARQSFTYHAAAGRARSDRFTATVWPLPRLSNPRIELDYPSYTGLLKHEGPLGQGIEAVEGTRVRLIADLNTPVREASLEINGQPVVPKPELSAGSPRYAAFGWTLTAEHSGEAVIRLKNHLGREIEALRFPVEVLADQAPQVVIVSPTKKELRVRPDELLRIQYEVTEDFGLKTTGLEVNTGGDRGETLPLDLPFANKGSLPPRFDGVATASIGKLRSRFPGKDQLKLRIRAEDGRPADLGGPGVGFSDWLTIRIDRNAESLARQELRAEHDEARETLEKAIQEARQAKDQIDGLREEVKKDQMNENAVKRLEQTTQKLASAEEKLAELAKEMELGIHAAKADEVAKAAEQLEAAKEAIENAPLQDQAQNREEQLNEAKKDAEEAIKQLEEARNAMDRDREKVQDLARVQELAQQQQELARQAQENLQQTISPQDQKQWQNEQQQVVEQLRQQLRERPDAKAEALKQQAEAAKGMAQEAREIAEAQQNLQQQAQQAAQQDPSALKEKLQQAISKEQEKIAAEAKEQLAQAQQDRTEAADVLPEATTAADAAVEQLKNNEPQAAAEAAKKAAQAMKDAVQQSPASEPSPAESAKPEAATAENAAEQPAPDAQGTPEPSPGSQVAEAAQAEALGELAERQEQVAGAMEALAKGDLDAALQALQDAHAEAAANLAEEIKETPLVDGSGNMNEAANNAQQGARQAESAEQQGTSGKQQEAAQQHEQAARNFQKSAEALERAAQEFSKQAEQLASQPANPNKAELPAAEMAEAFGQAGEAANSEGAEAAQAAAEAAEALAQAAQSARSQMQGRPQPGQPGFAQQRPGPNGLPGEKPPESMENLQQRSADPGVPPELAKLGISAADWEKIKANLAGDIGAGGADAVPEEYRGLVKGYFESMSKKKD